MKQCVYLTETLSNITEWSVLSLKLSLTGSDSGTDTQNISSPVNQEEERWGGEGERRER